MKHLDRGAIFPAHEFEPTVSALSLSWVECNSKADTPSELPSQAALAETLSAIVSVLFPRHFGPSGLAADQTEAFIRKTLAEIVASLFEQLRREFWLVAKDAGAEIDAKAQAVTLAFTAKLPEVRHLLETDIEAAFRGDPAARSLDEILLCYPGIAAVIRHRLAHELYRLGATLIARLISETAHSATGIDIHPGATIGGSFFIDHGTGVVIGETAIIGRNVRIYQAVTLGAKRFAVDDDGALVKGGARHPIIEDDVVIYAGATVLGRITVGKGSTIGGNVWLTQSVPPGSNISQTLPRNDLFIGGGGI